MNHSKDTENKTDSRSPIKTIFDKFSNHRDVTLIYGNPIKHEKQCIVPVAKMNFSFGAGSGGETTNTVDNKQKKQNTGEGGGGYISVKPLGVYEMTDSQVRFKPAIDVKFLVTTFSILTLGMTLLLKGFNKK